METCKVPTLQLKSQNKHNMHNKLLSWLTGHVTNFNILLFLDTVCCDWFYYKVKAVLNS